MEKTYEIYGLDETHAQNVDVEEVTSPMVTVVDFRIDASGSMDIFADDMRECLAAYRDAVSGSKQADEMLVSKTTFNGSVKVGGYVLPADFDSSYDAGGMTALYDAICDAHDRLLDYVSQLEDNGNNVNPILVILSDGLDNASNNGISDARRAIADMMHHEVTVAFIAFGQDAFGIAKDLNIPDGNVKEVSNDPSALRHVINLVSKSAISASKKASSGAANTSGDGFFDV